jgi:hypothetical protein
MSEAVRVAFGRGQSPSHNLTFFHISILSDPAASHTPLVALSVIVPAHYDVNVWGGEGNRCTMSNNTGLRAQIVSRFSGG